MTQAHEQILNSLNEAYAKDKCIENAKKLVEFVNNELQNEVIDIEYYRKNDPTAIAFGVVMLYSLISMLLVFILGLLIPETWITGPLKLILVVMVVVVVVTTAFESRGGKHGLYKFFQKHLDTRLQIRKMLNLYLQAKEQISSHEKQIQGQELIRKYLDRKGNPIDVEQFKCENPKDIILVPFPFTCGTNLGILCRAVLMQKSILSPMMISLKNQTIESKLAQIEFEKNLPHDILQMIDSCATYNMQISGALYALIHELNISENTPDYGYIKQFLEQEKWIN